MDLNLCTIPDRQNYHGACMTPNDQRWSPIAPLEAMRPWNHLGAIEGHRGAIGGHALPRFVWYCN